MQGEVTWMNGFLPGLKTKGFQSNLLSRLPSHADHLSLELATALILIAMCNGEHILWHALVIQI